MDNYTQMLELRLSQFEEQKAEELRRAYEQGCDDGLNRFIEWFKESPFRKELFEIEDFEIDELVNEYKEVGE